MIRNFTPHEIVVRIDEKELRFPSEGIARVKVNQVEGIPIDGIPVNLQEFGEVEGLPEPETARARGRRSHPPQSSSS